MTHFSLSIASAVSLDVVVVVVVVVVVAMELDVTAGNVLTSLFCALKPVWFEWTPGCCFEWPPFVFWYNLLNLIKRLIQFYASIPLSYQ